MMPTGHNDVNNTGHDDDSWCVAGPSTPSKSTSSTTRRLCLYFVIYVDNVHSLKRGVRSQVKRLNSKNHL